MQAAQAVGGLQLDGGVVAVVLAAGAAAVAWGKTQATVNAQGRAHQKTEARLRRVESKVTWLTAVWGERFDVEPPVHESDDDEGDD